MNKHCLPCTGSTAKLQEAQQNALLKFLHPDWKVVDQHHLEKTFKFADFQEALTFTNKIGEIAEEEGHHPDITLTWGKVVVKIWTHKIDGLSENDFILSSRIDLIRLLKKVCF
jgi:4a-hydroxytetrahydrobiopterin dehydratase